VTQRDETPGSSEMLVRYAAATTRIPEPGNFQSLLGYAAGRIGDKRRLVLVMDGFDEVEPVSTGHRSACRCRLPSRVYMVGVVTIVHPGQTIGSKRASPSS
jgi:hypothetical protein